MHKHNCTRNHRQTIGWGWTYEGSAVTQIEGMSTPTLVYTVEKGEDKWATNLASSANCWDAQLVSPVFNWGEENAGKAFIIEFKVAYEQAAGYQYPRVRIAMGKNGIGADQFRTDNGIMQQYQPDSLLTDDGEYKDIVYSGFYAGGKVQFEIDFGYGPGTYTFSEIKITIGDQVVHQAFNKDITKVDYGWTYIGSAITKIEEHSASIVTVEKPQSSWAKDLTTNANCWDARLISPVFDWGEENAGKAFIIEFKTAYEQAAGYQYPRVRVATGTNGIGADQFCLDWKAEEGRGTSYQYLPDFLLTNDGTLNDIIYSGFYAGGEVQFEIDFGHGPGTYTFSEIKITIGDQVVHQAYPVNIYTVTTNAENGSIKGGGKYVQGARAKLIATAEKGFRFTKWNDGNTNNPRIVTVNSDIEYTAEFEKDAEQDNIENQGNNNDVAINKNEPNKLLISPSPASSVVTICGVEPNTFVKVYNISGIMVITSTLDGNILNVSNLSKGIYIVETENGNIARFVKQ